MRGIITVIGRDQVGIIARVCGFLSESGVNILDISQSIVQEYFNMIMIVDMSRATAKFEDLAAGFEALGAEIGVKAKLQHEDIFNAMHRV